jgi:hypothetical protein
MFSILFLKCVLKKLISCRPHAAVFQRKIDRHRNIINNLFIWHKNYCNSNYAQFCSRYVSVCYVYTCFSTVSHIRDNDIKKRSRHHMYVSFGDAWNKQDWCDRTLLQKNKIQPGTEKATRYVVSSHTLLHTLDLFVFFSFRKWMKICDNSSVSLQISHLHYLKTLKTWFVVNLHYYSIFIHLSLIITYKKNDFFHSQILS